VAEYSRSWDIHITPDQRNVWVADGTLNKFEFDKSGICYLGHFGSFPGGL
jgi:hypothetical protein